VWLWAQQYNLRLGEPLSGTELHKIFNSITSYQQYPKSASRKSTKASKKPRPYDNITIATAESRLIVQAAYQAVEEGRIEKVEYDILSAEADCYIYLEGYEHILLPKLREKYPDMRIEDITHSQKMTFNLALGNLFQWGPAVPKFKGHARISTQVGYRLNIVPKPIAIEHSTSKEFAIKDSNLVNIENSTELGSISVKSRKIDPSQYFSAKEFDRILATNKEFKRWWKNKKEEESRGLYESSVGSNDRKPFRVVPDWRREAERWYRQYMEWRFDIRQ
jgi:hypothetical protein